MLDAVSGETPNTCWIPAANPNVGIHGFGIRIGVPGLSHQGLGLVYLRPVEG